jgi:hypothetical protein
MPQQATPDPHPRQARIPIFADWVAKSGSLEFGEKVSRKKVLPRSRRCHLLAPMN